MLARLRRANNLVPAFMPFTVAIALVLARLRRANNLVCCVKNALRAFFTQHTKLGKRRRHELASGMAIRQSLVVICCLSMILVACASPTASPSGSNNHHSLSTQSGPITYSTTSNDVLVRTFRGGGNMGTLEISPEISIYGDGAYILGPGVDMQQGRLNSDELDRLLHTLVDTDGLLGLNRQQFYDLPDQNATLLQLTLNGKHYEYLYGQFGNLQESARDMDEYHRLGNALASIIGALSKPLQAYNGTSMALLVHQVFNPDLTQTIPSWTFPDFTLDQVAAYECGITPQDLTGPDADSGCLTFTVPHATLLLTARQAQQITSLLNGHRQGVFYEQGLYYSAAIRPLLPDELPAQMLAMFGSRELSYITVPLHKGPIPVITPAT